MKPVAICRHAAAEGPGYFADFLRKNAIDFQLVKIDEGETLPRNSGEFSGLAFMGGPMSVNDDLPWIDDSLRLIADAASRDIPLIGHCLGGQLLARALGAKVGKNPVKEIGWGKVTVANSSEAEKWLGDRADFEAFHWHGETFELPENAVRILSSRWCENQAFSLGKHLAMQCHVEMTAPMVRAWCELGEEEILQSQGQSVQDAAAMQIDLDGRIRQLNRVAEKIYSTWIAGLSK